MLWTYWCRKMTHRENADLYLSIVMPRHRFGAKRKAMTGSGGAVRRGVLVQSLMLPESCIVQSSRPESPFEIFNRTAGNNAPHSPIASATSPSVPTMTRHHANSAKPRRVTYSKNAFTTIIAVTKETTKPMAMMPR